MTPAEALAELHRIGTERAFRRDDAPLLVTHDQARALRRLDEQRESDAIARGYVPPASGQVVPLGFAVTFVVDQAAATLPDWTPDQTDPPREDTR